MYKRAGDRTFLQKIGNRLRKHSIAEHLLGLWIGRRLTRSGITVASGGFPLLKVINHGGTIEAENCQFFSGTRLEVGPNARLRIGKGTYINRNTLVIANNSVEIGEGCKISWDVIIMDTDQHTDMAGMNTDAPVVIGDNVWIGCRSIILKGVKIGAGAVVAAGAVVTKDIPAGMIAAGVPAKVLRPVEKAVAG